MDVPKDRTVLQLASFSLANVELRRANDPVFATLQILYQAVRRCAGPALPSDQGMELAS